MFKSNCRDEVQYHLWLLYDVSENQMQVLKGNAEGELRCIWIQVLGLNRVISLFPYICIVNLKYINLAQEHRDIRLDCF